MVDMEAIEILIHKHINTYRATIASLTQMLKVSHHVIHRFNLCPRHPS